ncbi:MAG: response regulator transcription factor [Mariprofundus sp.]|nr:response regulator transcription factor [Mariprofundus sp.]
MIDLMKIIIADDHALFRDGLHVLLQALGQVQVVEARNRREIEAHLKHGDVFDLLLLDLDMPGIANSDGVKRICESAPQTAVIVISGNDAGYVVKACMDAGAMGFISKSSGSKVMLAAIQMVLAGERYVSSGYFDKSSEHALDHSSTATSISPRQQQIWQMLIDGKSNKEISIALSLSESTVKQHISALFRKLGVHSRTQAIQKAHLEKM